MNKSTLTDARKHLLSNNTRIDIKPIPTPERTIDAANHGRTNSRDTFIHRDKGDYATASSYASQPRNGSNGIVPYINYYDIPKTNPNNFYGKAVSSTLLPIIDGNSMDRSKLDGTNVVTNGLKLSTIRGESNNAFHKHELERREELIKGHRDFLKARRGGLIDSVNTR